MGSKFASTMINKDAAKTPGPGGYDPNAKASFKYDGHTKFWYWIKRRTCRL